MRKLISLMHISLDGFTMGPNGELDWTRMDEEIYGDVEDLLRTVDTAIYGRVTYGMMESYWPTVPTNPQSTELELHHAHWVEQVQKIVFSTTLQSVGWNNTTLVQGNSAEALSYLKQQPGGDIMIFGSPRLVHAFMQQGVIDEYRINVNPVVLGDGIPLFKDVKQTMELELVGAKTFRAGVVGLHYRTVPGTDAQ